MRSRNLIGVSCLALTLGLMVGSFVNANTPLLIVRGGSFFVAVESYPTNATYVNLVAGQWAQNVIFTIASNVNSTTINFKVYQGYQTTNQTLIESLNTTLTTHGTIEVYLGLGSASILSPEYTDISWTCH